jgi:hypothetical protein
VPDLQLSRHRPFARKTLDQRVAARHAGSASVLDEVVGASANEVIQGALERVHGLLHTSQLQQRLPLRDPRLGRRTTQNRTVAAVVAA